MTKIRDKSSNNHELLPNRKQQLDKLRPFPEHALGSLHDSLIVDWTYNSNAIEGNTLTLKETKLVLEDGITVGGKSLREHFEAVNHREAILYVEDIVQKAEPLSEWQIKSIHRLILQKIDDSNAGRYRTQNVVISGARHIPPDFLQIPGEMQRFIEWYRQRGTKYHPIEKAALIHTLFVKNHPFVDGNGRTARLLMNFELMKDGYLPWLFATKIDLGIMRLSTSHTPKEIMRVWSGLWPTGKSGCLICIYGFCINNAGPEVNSPGSAEKNTFKPTSGAPHFYSSRSHRHTGFASIPSGNECSPSILVVRIIASFRLK